MKYFTKEWWENGCDGAIELFAKYEEYLCTIRNQIPDSLIELYERHTLHDSEVKRIVSLPLECTVSVELLGWDKNLQFPVRYVVKFMGVTRFEQLLPQEQYVEQELGDIGYWECELLSSGIEVRILFVSGAVFTVNFADFEFSTGT